MHKIPMPPAMLNGYPVIAEKMIDNSTFAVVMHRRNHAMHPYVVASWSIHSPNEWQHGYYTQYFLEAAQVFAAKGES